MKYISTKSFARVIILVLILTMTCWLIPESVFVGKSYAATTLKNPRITKTSSTKAKQNVSWDCIYFGSYPQSEVICETDNEMPDWWQISYGKGSIKVSSKTWKRIVNAKYNSNGDATIGKTKYHRIKKSDSTWSYGYWGTKDWKNPKKYHYFKYEPIKWRVLKVNGKDAFLLADKALDSKHYHSVSQNITWEKCSVRSWLNSTFFNTAFSTSQKKAIKTTNVKNENNIESGVPGGNDTQDKIFLLSEREVYYTAAAQSYGFVKAIHTKDEARRCKSSQYAKAMGCEIGSQMHTTWDLRSPGGEPNGDAAIADTGQAYNWSSDAFDSLSSTRPAMHINLSASTWKRAGTVKSSTIVGSKESSYKPASKVNIKTAADSGKMKLFNDESGSVGKKAITKIFPGDYQIKLDAVNTKVVKENQFDGTYKIKVTIGLNDNAALGSEKGWNNLVNDVKKARRNVNNVNTLKTLVNKWSAKQGQFKITNKFNVKPEMRVVGYYQAICDEKGRLISDEGGAVLEAKCKGSATQYAFTLPIPCPYYVDLGLSLKMQAGVGIGNLIGTSSPKLSGSVSMGPSIYAGCGVGVKEIAALGIEGNAGLDFQLIPASKGTLVAGIDVKATVFGQEMQYSIAKAKYWLWDKTGKSTSAADHLGAADYRVKTIDRSFEKKTTAWDGDSQYKLQGSILPSTVPVMVESNGISVMVFQENDETRDAVNCTRLMYSVYDGQKWSDPEAVYDTGTADNFADIKVIGDEIYVVWQKCRIKVAETNTDAQSQELAQNSEICVGHFDQKSLKFEDTVYLTNNSSMDASPHLIDKNGTPAVMWLNNKNDNLFMDEGNNNVMISEVSDAGWTSPENFTVVGKAVSEFDGTYYNGEYHMAYIGVEEADDSVTARLYVSGQDKSFSALETNEETIAGVYFEGSKLCFNQNGQLAKRDLADGTTEFIGAGEMESIGSNVVEKTRGNKTALLWMTNEENGCRFYSTVKTENGYSKPVELYHNQGVKGTYYSAVLKDDGTWEIAFCGASLLDPEKSSLYFIKQEEAPKTVLDSIVVNEAEAEDQVQPISYTVKNESEVPMKTFDLTIRADNEVVKSESVECDIAPGESAYFEDEVELDPENSVTALSVETVAEGQSDLESARQEEELINTNLELETTKIVEPEEVTFQVVVNNNGSTDASGKIAIYEDETKEHLLREEELDTLEAGESCGSEFVFTKDELSFDEEDTAHFFIEVAGDTQESDDEDNKYYGVLYQWELEAAQPKDISALSITGIADKEYTGEPIEQELVVQDEDDVLEEDVDYEVEYRNNVKAGTATCIISGLGHYKGSVTKTFKITGGSEESDVSRERISGLSRYETAVKIADSLKKELSVDKFDSIIVADGKNYPDALAGSYLAKKKQAPVLLVDKSYEKMIAKYIDENLETVGTVYILGGTGAVSKNFETNLKNMGITVKRLSGASRYDTNIAILREADVDEDEILLCSGNGFADSLSASAAGKPILLVDKAITATQSNLLDDLQFDELKIYIIGGTGAVNNSVEKESAQYGVVKRLAGKTRYDTSKAVADEFFGNASKAVVLAYGQNFPDGLAGGPLAMSIQAPLLLVENSAYSKAAAYVEQTEVTRGVVLGGPSLISDDVFKKIVH